jgi:CBS domain-containing protein
MFDARTVASFGIGYVLGARAGRERYQELRNAWRRLAGSPAAQELKDRGQEVLGTGLARVGASPRRILRLQTVEEVMSSAPRTVAVTDSLVDAAKAMEQEDVGSVVVLDQDGQIFGILTDRDIVVRAVTAGRSMDATAVQEVCTKDPTTIRPSDTVEEAFALMRQRAVRRLPVAEGGALVGILSLGDLAERPGAGTALEAISEAPPDD